MHWLRERVLMPNGPASTSLKHVFVLMLENRSFDHMLGFSGITGVDAVTGQPTSIDGLTGTESNSLNGVPYPVSQPADLVMPIDPAHEFTDVLKQLCGVKASYAMGGPYPAVNNSGFVADYSAVGGQSAPAEIMKCYGASQLPVLNALAKEFVVFDHWFSSLPGPTWPNRFFVHAASSGGLDHSPSGAEIALWETLSGFQFQNGTIFDALNKLNSKHGWRLYSGGPFPCVAGLRGINNFEIHDFDDFARDVGSAEYSVLYTFIEPNYGDVVSNTFRGGNSQHPLDDVTHGEALIKTVYEAIRKSPIWTSSLLIVTWDEHGGFFDHVAPPAVVAPGDSVVTNGASQFGFTFEQCGPRVPAVAVSPLIPKNLIDHRNYDHASIPATLEALFGFKPLTQRDANARSVTCLATLTAPRTDTPATLPNPASSAGIAAMATLSMSAAGPSDSIDKGNLPGFLHVALRTDLALSRPEQRPIILSEFKRIKTRADAQRYLDHVQIKVNASRAAAKQLATRSGIPSANQVNGIVQFPVHKLGKHPARHDPRTLLLAKYISAKDLPSTPSAKSWADKVQSWPMMRNDTIGDCTCAAAGHLIECWSANASTVVIPTDDQIVVAYSAITGYDPVTGKNDNGANELDVLNYWRQTGIANQKIGAFVALEPGNHNHVMEAVFLFGGCYIGLALPMSAQHQQVWSVPPTGPRGPGAPGSWGGHAVPIVAYDARGLTCITWGAKKRMTWTFWDAYCDEAYAIISSDWFGNQGKCPLGFDLAQLSQDLQELT